MDICWGEGFNIRVESVVFIVEVLVWDDVVWVCDWGILCK